MGYVPGTKTFSKLLGASNAKGLQAARRDKAGVLNIPKAAKGSVYKATKMAGYKH